MWQDLRHSVRMLRQTPAFTALAIFVLALGIGVNTAIFSVVNAVLFRPPDVRAPDELRYVYQVADRFPGFNYREYLALIDAGIFSGLVAVSTTEAKIGSGADARLTSGEAVSANYFQVLGVAPVLGRAFDAGLDEGQGATPAVIISHALWTRAFASNPNILGSVMTLTRRNVFPEDQWSTYTIVGIAPEGFTGIASPWAPTDFWVPMVQRVTDYRFPGPTGPPLRTASRDEAGVRLAVGRLRPDVDDTRAQLLVRALSDQLKQTKHPAVRDSWSLALGDSRRVPLPFDPLRKIVPERLAAGLMSVAGLVLLIAVTNLAGMLIARGVTRRAELAVRLALGASRWQVTRRLLTEGWLLALAGGLGGVALAQILLILFVDQSASGFGQYQIVPFALDVSIDASVLLFTAAVCAGVGVLVTFAPVRQASRTNLLESLTGSVAAGTLKRTRVRVRHLILIPQVCLSTALLLVAGVLTKPLLESERVNPGYEAEGLAAVDFYLPPKQSERGMKATENYSVRRHVFQQRVLDVLTTSPAVSSVALVMGLPAGAPWKASVTARDAFPSGPYWWVSQAFVSSGYFTALGMKVSRGRAFDARDRQDAVKVAIIDETLARWLWPGENAVGQHLATRRAEDTRPPEWVEIVGVVNEVQPPLTTGQSNPFIYIPLGQGFEQAQTILVRGPAPVGELLRVIRQTVYDAEPTAELMNGGTVDQRIAALLYPRRMAAGILMAAGLIGLVLSAAGLYGVISYSVAQRLRELGIRATLGANPLSLMTLVLREGAKVALVGASLGLVVAYFGIQLTSRLVVAVPQLDQVVVTAVPLILGVVVLAACFVPARRASKVDPIVVLRTN